MKRYEKLKEIAKQKGKLLLIESVSYIPNKEDIVQFDQTKLVEDSSGKKFEARGILKNAPVTRYHENENGRIYEKKLWENVKKKGMFEGSDCLADHAEDDGSVLNTAGVWHNFSVNEETGNADLYCIGEAGQLLLEKAKAGGQIGFSTVGYGELSESDNKTVIPETFEYCNTDWVRNPSQKVYATIENLSESVQKIEEKVIENKNIENEITNIIMEKNTKEVKHMDKIAEASLKNQVRIAISEATESSNYAKAIKDLTEVNKIVPDEMVEDKVKIESAVSLIQEKLEIQRAETQKQLSESKETLESLQEKYDKANEVITELKENLKKASVIVSKAGKFSESDFQSMKEDLKQFVEDRIKMEADINLLKEEIESRDSDISCFTEDRDNMLADIKCFKEDRENMIADIKLFEKENKKFKKHLKKAEKVLEEYGYEFEDGFEAGYEAGIEDALDDDIYVDDVYEDDFNGAYDGYDDDIYFEAKKEDEDDEIDEDEDEDDKMAKVRAAKKEAKKKKEDEDDEDELEESSDDDEDEEDDDDEKEESKKKKESLNPAVVTFYKEAVRKTPAIREIKGKVLSSKSVMEAVKKVQSFENAKFGNDTMSLKESKRPEKLVDYKFSFHG
jgi:hypothetical protein